LTTTTLAFDAVRRLPHQVAACCLSDFLAVELLDKSHQIQRVLRSPGNRMPGLLLLYSSSTRGRRCLTSHIPPVLT
jgi:hypothetical protein